MKIKSTIQTLAILVSFVGVATSAVASGQDLGATPSSRSDAYIQNITLRSKGGDAREVIAQLFEQAGQEYVIEANVKQTIYLSISDVPFGTALDILSRLADVSFLKKKGVWYVVKARAASATPGATSGTAAQKIVPNPKPSAKAKADATIEQTGQPDQAAALRNPTPEKNPSPEKNPMVIRNQRIQSPLAKRVLTRMTKADIRAVFTEFAMQTGVEIIVAEDVPNFKLDAFMIETSLKYALDEICKATKLKYQLTPGKTVLIRKA